jgi:hypothetical protein
MGPGRGRGFDKGRFAVHDHVFDHDHRVHAVGKAVAGIDEAEVPSGVEAHGRALAGGEGGLGAHGDAVHGRAVEGGGGIPGDDGRGGDAAGGALHGDGFDAEQGLAVKALLRRSTASSRGVIFR